MEKLFVLKFYFWDGDGILSYSLMGVYNSLKLIPQEVINFIPYKKDRNFNDLNTVENWKGCYMVGEEIPKHEGHYRSSGFYAIEEVVINKFLNND